MQIKSLKLALATNISNIDFLVLKNSDNSFLAEQYTNEIITKKSSSVNYIDSLDGLYFDNPFLDDSVIYVFRTDELTLEREGLLNKNIIIICNKIKKIHSCYSDFVVEMPKLKEWQIKDYIYSSAIGLTDTQLEQLYSLCSFDIYRASVEIAKLKLFTETERSKIFEMYLKDGQYSDLNQRTLFNLCNAIIRKDLPAISKIYIELSNTNFNVIGFIQLLYTNFKNIINVQLAKYPTAESCGMKPNQFYAVKHQVGFYTREQLIQIFSILTDVDKQLKTGQLGTEHILDYVITRILNL